MPPTTVSLPIRDHKRLTDLLGKWSHVNLPRLMKTYIRFLNAVKRSTKFAAAFEAHGTTIEAAMATISQMIEHIRQLDCAQEECGPAAISGEKALIEYRFACLLQPTLGSVSPSVMDPTPFSVRAELLDGRTTIRDWIELRLLLLLNVGKKFDRDWDLFVIDINGMYPSIRSLPDDDQEGRMSTSELVELIGSIRNVLSWSSNFNRDTLAANIPEGGKDDFCTVLGITPTTLVHQLFLTPAVSVEQVTTLVLCILISTARNNSVVNSSTSPTTWGESIAEKMVHADGIGPLCFLSESFCYGDKAFDSAAKNKDVEGTKLKLDELERRYIQMVLGLSIKKLQMNETSPEVWVITQALQVSKVAATLSESSVA